MPAPHASAALAGRERASGWSLDPRVYEKPGQFTGCPDGQRNAVESECLDAVQAATTALGLDFDGHTFKVMDEGADGWVPSGCSYSRGHGLQAIFNRNPAGRNWRSYPLACIDVVQATAADPDPEPEPAPVTSEADSAQPIPAGWSLDPRVYEEPGQFTGCPKGQRNADESECFAAAQEATTALGLAFVRAKPSRWWTPGQTGGFRVAARTPERTACMRYSTGTRPAVTGALTRWFAPSSFLTLQ